MLSRSHPGLVKQLFALEVPEIKDGIVEIMGVSREAGHRTKIAVRSLRAGVSPKGSLIGPLGARSRAVMDELNGEKIDIVDFDEDPTKYVAHALAPAKVTSVTVVDELSRSAKVVVPDLPTLTCNRKRWTECSSCSTPYWLAYRYPSRYPGANGVIPRTK